MRLKHGGVVLVLAAGLAVLLACVGENQPAPPSGSQGAIVKGGDDRTGEYEAAENWWKPAPDHEEPWTWGQVSGVAVDNPNRIIVAIWGDRDREGRERPDGTNYLVVVDRNGDILERWTQWDSILNKPHQVYISPYDPERHVWIVEHGGGRGVNMQILKVTNDGSDLVMKLVDRKRHGRIRVLAFLPDGSFYLGDGYWHSRIVKYNADGDDGVGGARERPRDFDLVHGLAVDREHRVYVGDRTNNRIQIFTEDGEFIEEWTDISDPVGVFIDENDGVWVISAKLNRILKYSRDSSSTTGGRTDGGFAGGLSRPTSSTSRTVYIKLGPKFVPTGHPSKSSASRSCCELGDRMHDHLERVRQTLFRRSHAESWHAYSSIIANPSVSADEDCQS